MRSVKLNFLLMFFLIFGLSYQGYADCPWVVPGSTEIESAFGWKGWRKEIKVIAIKNQGVDGYFNPRIKVCSYGGESYPEYCHELYKTSCKKIYGTQDTGAGISAMVFIDWEGNKTSVDAKIADGLGWEWAEGVTDEEKIKFAHSPKICACSQKGACRSGFVKFWDKPFSAIDYSNFCDTCYQTKVKCAPIPLAPGPPPLCEQLAMSPPQVRIVPITNKDNDYFNPKVKVIIGDLKGEDGKIGKKLGFPEGYGIGKLIKHPISDKDGTTHYFETYREKDKLCAKYYGTQGIDEKNLQFVRCFPAPPAPEPKRVNVVNKNTLEVETEMNKRIRTFNVNTSSSKNIGSLSLKVVKPAIIVAKTTDSNDNKDTDDVTKRILKNIEDIEDMLKNGFQFEILKKYGYIPDVQVKCSKGGSFYSLSDFKTNLKSIQCEFNHSGQPEIEVKYKENSKSKMLCLSGWQLEPEEFILKRESELISLKSMGTSYAKYNIVYSKESNQLYYFPCNETVDILAKEQNELDEIIFNKRGYVSIPAENKNRDNCTAEKDDEMDIKQDCNKCKIVYELIDRKHKEKDCNQNNDDGCLCFNGACSRSTQYSDKKNNDPFYLKVLQRQDGVVEQLDLPIKANRTEVFYADKLCGFDLQSVEKEVLETIKKRLKSKNLPQPYEFSGDNNYTNDLSKYSYIEIEAWGGGEAGHIAGTAYSTESRPGMPGDYIKVQLKIDSEYPIIRAQATEGGGGLTNHISNKDGGPTFIKMCKDSSGGNCKDLITVTGGGKHKKYGDQEYRETKVHDNLGNLKILGNPTIVTGTEPTQGNQIAYIENGKIEHKVVQCSNASSNTHGAGGCIDKNSQAYGRGSPGYVIIRSIKIDDEEVKKIINALVKNPDSNDINNLIKELYPGIIEEIKEEIRKELETMASS